MNYFQSLTLECYSFQYEIIFCIEDEADSQLKLYITSLKSKYPHVDTQVRHTFRRLEGIHIYVQIHLRRILCTNLLF